MKKFKFQKGSQLPTQLLPEVEVDAKQKGKPTSQDLVDRGRWLISQGYDAKDFKKLSEIDQKALIGALTRGNRESFAKEVKENVIPFYSSFDEGSKGNYINAGTLALLEILPIKGLGKAGFKFVKKFIPGNKTTKLIRRTPNKTYSSTFTKPEMFKTGDSHIEKKIDPYKTFVLEYMDTILKPKTKNEKSLEVVTDFRKRLNSDEGKRRLKNLAGDDYENRLNHLNSFNVKDNRKTIAHYASLDKDIHINPALAESVRKGVTRHEIEHVVQKGDLTDIDKSLKNLEVKYKSKENPYGEDTYFKGDKDENYYKRESSTYDQYSQQPDYKSQSANYFTYGSEGKEKSAFLAEMQQWALDNKLVKHPYDNIDKDDVKSFYINYQFNKNYPLRIFDIIKPNEKNFQLIADNYNKLLSVGAITTAGAATLTNQQNKKEYQQGGQMKKFKFKYKKGGTQSKEALLLDHTGKPQMKMYGGELIFSRKSTKDIINAAEKAIDEDGLYKLGKIVYDERKAQRKRDGI